MINVELALGELDARGVDMHVLSASTVVSGTAWAPPAQQAISVNASKLLGLPA
jgi:hypothetical protein